MSNQLYYSSQSLAKVVALSAMCHDFAEQLDFSYYQDFSASFGGISIDLKWEKKGDVKSLNFVISGEHSGASRPMFSYNLFDYNSEEDSFLYNKESFIEGLFESSKGYVTSDVNSSDFRTQVAENQRKFSMAMLINNYIFNAGKIMAKKIHN